MMNIKELSKVYVEGLFMIHFRTEGDQVKRAVLIINKDVEEQGGLDYDIHVENCDFPPDTFEEYVASINTLLVDCIKMGKDMGSSYDEDMERDEVEEWIFEDLMYGSTMEEKLNTTQPLLEILTDILKKNNAFVREGDIGATAVNESPSLIALCNDALEQFRNGEELVVHQCM